MQLKEGAVVEGKVTGITKYGAFVKLDGDFNGNGMIHISEISQDFVKDVGEHLKINQAVRAVVVAINENGRLALSIKRLNQIEGGGDEGKDKRGARDGDKIAGGQVKSPEEYVKPDRASKNSGSFEDMMNRFKQDSDEKIANLKNFEPKKNNYARRKTFQNNKGDSED